MGPRLKYVVILGSKQPVGCVRAQGDPLSPHLFNAVVDEAVYALGVAPDDKPVVMAFADDLVVLARTSAMLQHRLQKLTHALSQCGLSISPTKC